MYCGEAVQVELRERIGDDAQTRTLRIAGDDAGDSVTSLASRRTSRPYKRNTAAGEPAATAAGAPAATTCPLSKKAAREHRSASARS